MVYKQARIDHITWLSTEQECLQVLILLTSEVVAAAVGDLLSQGQLSMMVERVRQAEYLEGVLQKQNWDVIIADEKWLGCEALESCSQKEWEIPLILLCEHYTEEQAAQHIREGVYDCVGKENLIRLIPVIERVVREHKMRRLSFVKHREWLTAAVTHELKNAIQVERQLLTLFQQGRFGAINASQQSFIEGLLDSKCKMAQLIENLLCLFMEADYEHPDTPLPLDMNHLILEEMVGDFERLAQSKNLRLKLDLDETLPLLCVDALKVYLVLNNLLHNAVKYTEAGGQIIIKTRSNTAGATFSIEDTGIGIRPEYLDTLFAQISPDRQRYRSGAGLGLYLTKRLLDGLGGSIGVQSEWGKGSIFHFSLPTEMPMKHLI